jgi:UDP-N-acetylglucosamine diphosphorylase / glucose-1-phosphate thymidylyltransferase / UDP-N-acetylgalactosamine diphosphorylase / glucosamine-1-phosphate N-acetyltransferase / galactosamine-1-phosphate N-acetyltransferase
MKVILPMAGRGQRFKNEGITIPKPLIPVAGKPMVLHALDSLKGLQIDQLIVICLKETEDIWQVEKLIRSSITVPSHFIFIDNVTEGQLCTVLLAEEFLMSDEDVLVMAADSYIVGPLMNDIIAKRSVCDGIISVAMLPGDHWSFAKTNTLGKVIEVAEKERISDYASTGLYYFSRAKDLLDYGTQMVKNNERTRGEFYVIPVYQKMIKEGKVILTSLANEMWDMGTPKAKADFEQYLTRTKPAMQ